MVSVASIRVPTIQFSKANNLSVEVSLCSYQSIEAYVLALKRTVSLLKTVLLSTHKICFGRTEQSRNVFNEINYTFLSYNIHK